MTTSYSFLSPTHVKITKSTGIRMEEILIAVALIIVVALLFWLDKKAERGTPEAGSMYKEILQTFERVWWCMSSGELKEIFPNKQFSDREESDGLAGIGYTDQIEGH